MISTTAECSESRGVDRRGAALDVVHVRALVDDDQGPLELAHVLGVDPEVGLQRDVDLHALRHVDEGAAGPHRGVQRGELVVADRDHRGEVLLEQLRVLAQRRVGVQEDDALLLEVLADLVVDDLGLVLRGDAGDQALLLRLGDAEPVVGVLDVGGQVVPARRLLLGRAHEVLDVVEVDAGQVRAPGRHRLAAGTASGPSAAGRASTPARSSSPRCRGRPPRSGRGARTRRPRPSRTSRTCSGPGPRARGGAVVVMRRFLRPRVCGGRSVHETKARVTCVVQTPSPWAIVARRCTGVPSRRPNASVSASHSCGNSAATWATGQWCWQSCSPPSAIARGPDRQPRRRSRRRTAPRPAPATRWSRRGRLDQPAGTCARARRSACRANSATAPGPGPLGQEAQGAGGQVVVGVLEGAAAGVGDREQPGRPAAAAAAVRPARSWPRPCRRPAGCPGGGGRRPDVRPSRADRPAAVTGPFSRMRRAIRPRVP